MATAYDVVVVGAGIGGLTVGALLSARGMNVCVLERQPQVGGCIARVEFSGHEFEPGMGIYTSFGEGDVYEGIFDQLPVEVPSASLLSRPYVVRLADGTDVRLTSDESFFDELRTAFPECPDRAIEFYRKPALETLLTTSPRFQSFIDTQLRGFLHTSIDQCSSVSAPAALARARGPLYEIEGGPATLAERLAESIKRSGGTVRLNTPVLRLAYDSNGAAAGVDLLNGEQVLAKKAIVSNLTIWDTYGKLVGLNRTPPEIKKHLNTLHGSGAYVVYATIEDAAIARLPGERLLVATRSSAQPSSAAQPNSDPAQPNARALEPNSGSARASSDTAEFDEAFTEITLAVHGRTATLKSATDVDDWFTYHAGEEDFEDSDQAALEAFWTKLHAALPELGGDVEVIETANPRTYYDQTRRKLGMILGLQIPKISFSTAVLPNLFVVGDTVTSNPDIATVAESALSLANHLHKNY